MPITYEPVNKITYEPVNKTSIPETIGRGLGQGVTFGFQPSIAGLVSAPIEAGINELTGANNPLVKGTQPSILDLYRQARGEEQTANTKAQESHPVLSGISQVAGSLPTSMVLPGGTLGAIGQGAAAGLGYSNADLSRGEIGKAALGAGIGALTGVGGALAGKALGKVLLPTVIPAEEGAERVAGGENLQKISEGLLGKKVEPSSIENLANPVVNKTVTPTVGETAVLKNVTGVKSLQNASDIINNGMKQAYENNGLTDDRLINVGDKLKELQTPLEKYTNDALRRNDTGAMKIADSANQEVQNFSNLLKDGQMSYGDLQHFKNTFNDMADKALVTGTDNVPHNTPESFFIILPKSLEPLIPILSAPIACTSSGIS